MPVLEHRWALGHEPIVEVPHPGGSGTGASPGGCGLPLTGAGALKGLCIVNRRHELLGHLVEVMLDVQHGRIAYAVMGAGGFFGLGARCFAIPWPALVMDLERECLVLDAARERFDHRAATVDGGDDAGHGRCPGSPKE